MLLGGEQARPPIPDVVGVGAGQHDLVAAARSDLHEPGVELGLAVVAAVASVRPIALALELGGHDRLVTDADGASDVDGRVELACRESRRDGRDGQRPTRERARRKGRDQRGVDAAGECDDRAA